MNEYYEPLRVTAKLAEPVILSSALPMDGILGATIISDPELREQDRYLRRFLRNVKKFGRDDAVRHYQQMGWEIPSKKHFIPLQVYGHGVEHGLWVYCSSIALANGEVQTGRTYFNKRLDTLQLSDWLEPAHTRIDTGKGQTKAEHIPLVYSAAESLTWYVRGEREQIEKILAVTFEIAKKRKRGYGWVREWGIEKMDDDWSVWMGKRLMRPVPSSLLEKMSITGDFEEAFTTYRPPYWDGRYSTVCAVAGERN